MTIPGLIRCTTYLCDLEETACALRYVTAQGKSKRIHLSHCVDCAEGRERQARIGASSQYATARFLPVFGAGLRK